MVVSPTICWVSGTTLLSLIDFSASYKPCLLKPPKLNNTNTSPLKAVLNKLFSTPVKKEVRKAL